MSEEFQCGLMTSVWTDTVWISSCFPTGITVLSLSVRKLVFSSSSLGKNGFIIICYINKCSFYMFLSCLFSPYLFVCYLFFFICFSILSEWLLVLKVLKKLLRLYSSTFFKLVEWKKVTSWAIFIKYVKNSCYIKILLWKINFLYIIDLQNY